MAGIFFLYRMIDIFTYCHCRLFGCSHVITHSQRLTHNNIIMTTKNHNITSDSLTHTSPFRADHQNVLFFRERRGGRLKRYKLQSKSASSNTHHTASLPFRIHQRILNSEYRTLHTIHTILNKLNGSGSD